MVCDQAGEPVETPLLKPAGAIQRMKPVCREFRGVPDVVQMRSRDQYAAIDGRDHNRDLLRPRSDCARVSPATAKRREAASRFVGCPGNKVHERIHALSR